MTTATVSCPYCSGALRVDVPSDACLYFLPCEHCGERIRPLAGDCCVICSYGDGLCPPRRADVSS